MALVTKWISLLMIVTLSLTASAQVDVESASSAAAGGSSLTVYVYPPRQRLNWQSPVGLLKSFLNIEVQRSIGMNDDVTFTSDNGEAGTLSSNYMSTMGHTIAHVRCALPNGALYDKWSSFSGQSSAAVDMQNTFHDKLGMGMLFYDFVDGHLLTGPENMKRLVHYDGKIGAPRYLQFKINAKKCADIKQMTDFFEGFHTAPGTDIKVLQARDPEKVLYFNTMDPYNSYMNRMRTGHGKVGGGCAPYGAALVKMAGQYNPVFETAWRVSVAVSEKLIGGIPDVQTGQINRVSVQDLLFSDLGRHWQYEGYPNRILNLYDPQKIWDFIGEVDQCLLNSNACSQAASTWKNAKSGKLRQGAEHVYSDFYKEPAFIDGGIMIKVDATKEIHIPGLVVD